MGVIRITHKGNLKKTEQFLQGASQLKAEKLLAPYGEKGVRALSDATPVDSGNTAGSWYYEIRKNRGSFSLMFLNRNINKGVPIAILIQYGHATGTGGYVQGRDYINPALQPVFDQMSKEIWEEVRGL